MTSQNLLEMDLESCQIKERTSRFENHQKVYIAVFTLVPSSDRPEDAKVLSAVSSSSGLKWLS